MVHRLVLVPNSYSTEEFQRELLGSNYYSLNSFCTLDKRKNPSYSTIMVEILEVVGEYDFDNDIANFIDKYTKCGKEK